MSERGTATEVASCGGNVARISPEPPNRNLTLRELVEKLRQLDPPDARFADDLAEIQTSQPPIGEVP